VLYKSLYYYYYYYYHHYYYNEKINRKHFSSWLLASVNRTSVFGRRTYPDLCPIHGWQATTSG